MDYGKATRNGYEKETDYRIYVNTKLFCPTMRNAQRVYEYGLSSVSIE